ncbi:MAG: hypothetical protein MHM6MM_001630 [Cercozoa sp. M6MM]
MMWRLRPRNVRTLISKITPVINEINAIQWSDLGQLFNRSGERAKEAEKSDSAADTGETLASARTDFLLKEIAKTYLDAARVGILETDVSLGDMTLGLLCYLEQQSSVRSAQRREIRAIARKFSKTGNFTELRRDLNCFRQQHGESLLKGSSEQGKRDETMVGHALLDVLEQLAHRSFLERSWAFLKNSEDLKRIPQTLPVYAELLPRDVALLAVLADLAYHPTLALPEGWKVLRNESKESDALRPGHLIVYNVAEKRAVVVVRGTWQVHDVVTNMLIRASNITLSDGDSDSKSKHSVHSGIQIASKNLFDDTEDLITNVLVPAGFNTIQCVGHSLGGACAGLLALQLRQKLCGSALGRLGEVFGTVDVSAVTFGSPPCVDESLAQKMRPFVTSIVNSADVVPRLSVASARSLFQELRRLEWSDQVIRTVAGRFLTDRAEQSRHVATRLERPSDVIDMVGDTIKTTVSSLFSPSVKPSQIGDQLGKPSPEWPVLHVPGRVLCLSAETVNLSDEETIGGDKGDDGARFVSVRDVTDTDALRTVRLSSEMLSQHSLTECYRPRLRALLPDDNAQSAQANPE